MEGILILSVIYWLAVAVLFLTGLIKVIIAIANESPTKSGVKLIIASLIMLVIGAGACAAILAGGIN